MLPQEIIAKKRDGLNLTREEIQQFIDGVVSGEFTDYQSTALLMTVVLNGMSIEETAWLTESMMRSGRIVELPEISRPKVDKHSTGGVGDKVSLILVPLASACGLCVPMMSGRGLGHTGGTLDKLESIPGFDVELSDAAYRKQLIGIHQAMIGQSRDMVPADRKLYALRDVTATVESIPLICASILSKKFAEGIDSLVLDVKCGSGAFMETEQEARKLARTLVDICGRVGKPAKALITRMDQPLGFAVGNSLEVIEAIECLKGNGPEDLMEVVFALTEEMLLLGRVSESPEEIREIMFDAIESGRALESFHELVIAQGGDPSILNDYSGLPLSDKIENLYYERDEAAYIHRLDARVVGQVARLLGAGRTHAESEIDLGVGIVLEKKTGARVVPGDLLARIYYRNSGSFEAAAQRLLQGFQFTNAPVRLPELVCNCIA